MTLEQIEDSFPNGFHDAELLAFNVDLQAKTLTLELKLDLSSPERDMESTESASKKIRVAVSGVEYFKLEPPDIRSANYGFDSSSVTSGTIIDNPELMDEVHRKNLPEGCFSHWLFLVQWNAFMVIAARDAAVRELHATEESLHVKRT